MLGMILKVATHLGSIASLAGMYFFARPKDMPVASWELLLGVLTLILIAASIRSEYNNWASDRPITCKNSIEITKSMQKIIQSSGRTAIFSRNLSWPDEEGGEQVKKILQDKARSGDLTLVVHSLTPTIQDLKEKGAEVIEYGKLNFVPSVRFTLINEGRSDARLAIAHPPAAGERGKHKIYQYHAGSHPIFHMAQDIIESFRKI